MAQISERAWIIKTHPTGEDFLRLQLFMKDSGLVSALKRHSTKKQATFATDIFDLGFIQLNTAKTGSTLFFQSFQLERRHLDLSKDYNRMKAAALYANFLLKNLVHLENYEFAWQLTDQFISAACVKSHPYLSAFKAFYLFAREEGYAVNQEWLMQKKPSQQNSIVSILKSPLSQIDATPEMAKAIIEDLFTYFQRSTDIIPPEF